MSAWPDWLKVIQLSPRFLFGLFLLGGMVLWLPDCWADFFGFTAVRSQYRGFIGVGTLAALVFWGIQLFPTALRLANKAKLRGQVLSSLDSLSTEERLLLAYCLAREQRTVTLSFTDGVARALTAKGLLMAAAGAGSILEWPFTIPDYVWDHLHENQDRIFGRNMPSETETVAYFQQLDEHISRHRRW